MFSLLTHTGTLVHSLRHLSTSLTDLHYDKMTSSGAHALATETVEQLRATLPPHLARPRVAMVCGSGLGGLKETVNRKEGEDEVVEWEYRDVVNFPLSTGMLGDADADDVYEGSDRLGGWERQLLRTVHSTWPRGPIDLRDFGREESASRFAGGKSAVRRTIDGSCICSIGANAYSFPISTYSFYEGHEMSTVTFATRVCALLGVEAMLLTNAAGGLNPEYTVGDVVCLNDHINIAGLAGFHPLRGPNADDFGVRFPPLSDAYDMELRRTAHRVWRKMREAQPSNRRMHEGVYAFVAGPSYETRAECRMLRSFGADVVGMSTVPELIAARHSGVKVLAFSLVTNNAVLEPTVRADDPQLQNMSSAELIEFMSRGKADHHEVLDAGKQAALDMQSLVLGIVSEL